MGNLRQAKYHRWISSLISAIRGSPTAISRPHVAPFALSQHATQLDETPATIASVPSDGNFVRDGKGVRLHLGVKLGKGGEGTVYETDRHLVCKVFHRGQLKRSTIDKLKLMTSRAINHPAICWPVSLAYNSHGEVVGYLMPKAQGKKLQSLVFIPISRLLQTLPHWTRLHLVKLTSTILDAVAYLHKLNVLLGDINGGNILVQDESHVFLVDCDSYQVESFPSPMGTATYLPPELHGKQLRSTLRTKEDEYFSIATLVFMILHLGKPPYSHRGGGDPSENVRKQHFPYPRRGNQNAKGVPSGPWGFLWNQWPQYMRDAFHRVFSDGDRLSVAEWQELMRQYKNRSVKGESTARTAGEGVIPISRYEATEPLKAHAASTVGERVIPSGHKILNRVGDGRHLIIQSTENGTYGYVDTQTGRGATGFQGIYMAIAACQDRSSLSDLPDARNEKVKKILQQP